MNLFSLTSLLLSITCFLLASLIFYYSKQKLHRLWASFNVFVGIYGLGMFLAGISKTYNQAFLSWKIAFFGVANISLFFYLVVYEFCGLSNRKMLSIVFAHGILFSVLTIATDWIVNSLKYVFNQFYFTVAGVGWNIFFFMWIVIVVRAFINLYNYTKISHGLKRLQGKYLFYAMLLGFLSGASTSLLAWGVNIYPVWHFFICVYAAICTYAIFRYRLMDIHVVFTRAGIFVVVYALVLGIPFGLYFLGKSFLFNLVGENWSIIPLVSAVLLATIGPFLYLFLQRKAEDILLRTQRQYQQALLDLSKSIVRLRNIEQLFDTVTHQLVYSVKVSYAAMYLVDKENKKLILKSEYYNPTVSSKSNLPNEISYSEPFLSYLENSESPLIVEEERLKLNHFFDIDTEVSLIIPCITTTGLASIIFLGHKPNHHLYTQNDILTFDTLANQIALAIENCQFAQDLADKERMARLQDMDAYSYSLAHEIDNPVQVIIAGVAYLQRQLLKELQLPQATQKDIDESLNLILEAARRISGMVKAIRDYGSALDADFRPLRIEEVVENFSYLTMSRFKEHSILYTKELAPNLGFVRGQKPELIQLLEIFASNSKDALEYSQEKKVRIKVFQPNPDTIRIEFSDTGVGIEKSKLHLIFSPFVTSKASSRGTGMGLANAKKIVERHRGKIWAESEGKDKGATFIVELPVAKDITEEDLKKKSGKVHQFF